MCCILRVSEAPGGPLEAGSDECLVDPASGRLKVSYSTVPGGSWEVQFVTKLSGLKRP